MRLSFLIASLRNLNLGKGEKIYLVLVLSVFAAHSIYRIHFYPIFIDEAHTYNWFTSQGIIASITTYPEPNNHIFYSIITNLTYYFPFDAKTNIRFPNLLIALTTSLFVYLLLRKLFNPRVAIIPHITFTFSYVVIFYSIFGRGYMLHIFFTSVCFYCVYMLQKDPRKLWLIIYSVCSVLGFYTVPTFLYISASFVIYLYFLFYKNRKMIIQLFIFHVLIALVVSLLYAPIIYFNGLDSIINNSFTKKISYAEIMIYFKEHIWGFYNVLTGVQSYLIFIPFLLSILTVCFLKEGKPYKNLTLFVLCFFLLPFPFIWLHKVIPNPRIWSYLIFPFALGLALIIHFVNERIKLKPVFFYVLAVPLIFFQLRVFNKSHPLAAMQLDYECSQLAELLMKNDYHTFYFHNRSTAYPFAIIKYNYDSRKIPFYAESDIKDHYFSNPNRYPSHNYDCVIYGSEPPSPPYSNPDNRKLILEKGYVQIFGKPERE